MNRHKNLKHILDEELGGDDDYYEEEYYDEEYNPNVAETGFTIDEYADKTLYTEPAKQTQPKANTKKNKKKKAGEKTGDQTASVQVVEKDNKAQPVQTQQSKGKKNKKKKQSKVSTEEGKKQTEEESKGEVWYA